MKIQPHMKPLAASAVKDWPGMFTPEYIAHGLNTLQLGISQFKEELAQGPDFHYLQEYAILLGEKTGDIWKANMLQRIEEWEAEARAYQALAQEVG